MKEEKHKTKKTIRMSKHIITKKKIYYSKNNCHCEYKYFVIIITKYKKIKVSVNSKVYETLEKILFKRLKK